MAYLYFVLFVLLVLWLTVSVIRYGWYEDDDDNNPLRPA